MKILVATTLVRTCDSAEAWSQILPSNINKRMWLDAQIGELISECEIDDDYYRRIHKNHAWFESESLSISIQINTEIV